MNRLILALATILTSSIASGFRAQNNGVPVRGLYCNYDYAYSVVVPQGITAFRDPPPLPNHGIGIDISKSQQSYIWVDASYNAAEWSSFADAVSDNLGYLKNDGAASIALGKQAATHLSQLRARRFIIRYRLAGKEMVQETVLAFRREKNKEEIVYSINLRTPLARYERDRMMVAQLQRTWLLRKQP